MYLAVHLWLAAGWLAGEAASEHRQISGAEPEIRSTSTSQSCQREAQRFEKQTIDEANHSRLGLSHCALFCSMTGAFSHARVVMLSLCFGQGHVDCAVGAIMFVMR